MQFEHVHDRGFGRVLRICCDVCAAVGGVVLVAMAAITAASIVGRTLFAHPILGDVELVQLGTATCVALFLPYTQCRGGNIIVDVFTVRAGAGTRAWMDALGALLFALSMALVCWRVYAGGLSAHENEETSMLMGIPLWVPYMLMVPGLALSAVIGAYHTVQHLHAGDEEAAQ